MACYKEELDTRTYLVYKHTSPSNKVYIGITSINPSKRWGANGCNYKDCVIFYNAIKKYGWNNIKHEILEEGLTREEALEKEIELIKKYNSIDNRYGYNLICGGSAPIMPESVRQKISIKKKGKKLSEEHKKAISSSLIGKHCTEEHKKHISEVKKGQIPWNKGISMSEKTYKKCEKTMFKKGMKPWNTGKKLSKANIEKLLKAERKNTKKVKCLETGVIYDKIADASRKTNIDASSISNVANGKPYFHTAGGYHWAFVK